MVRSIIGIIVGYIVMFAVVVVGLSIGFLALGADWAYEPGTFDVTMGWILLMFGVGFVAAIVGGIVCALISKHSKLGLNGLVLLVVLLGALSAFAVYKAPAPSPEDAVRAGDVAVFEAASKAVQPLWVAIVNPIVGALGVILGATFVRPKHGAGDGGEAGGES